MLKLLIGAILLLIFSSVGVQTHKVNNADQMHSPWYVLIEIGENKTRCGGTLIQDKYVITAAHCFENQKLEKTIKELRISIGEYDTKKDPDCDEESENYDEICDTVAYIKPKKIFIHENFKGGEILNNDIALIELKWKPKQSPLISNVNLPNETCCNSSLNANIKYDLAGFGNVNGSEVNANIKKKFEIKVVKNEICEEQLKKKIISSEKFCGSDELGGMTCPGDSGGGTIYNNTLQGIISEGGISCGVLKPTIFTKVSCYVSWIEDKIRGKIIVNNVAEETTEKHEEYIDLGD